MYVALCTRGGCTDREGGVTIFLYGLEFLDIQ